MGIPALVGAAVRVLGAGQVALSLEKRSEAGGFGRLVEVLVRTSGALLTDQLVSRLCRHLEAGRAGDGIALRSASVHPLRSGHLAADLSRHRRGGMMHRRPRFGTPGLGCDAEQLSTAAQEPRASANSRQRQRDEKHQQTRRRPAAGPARRPPCA